MSPVNRDAHTELGDLLQNIPTPPPAPPSQTPQQPQGFTVQGANGEAVNLSAPKGENRPR